MCGRRRSLLITKTIDGSHIVEKLPLGGQTAKLNARGMRQVCADHKKDELAYHNWINISASRHQPKNDQICAKVCAVYIYIYMCGKKKKTISLDMRRAMRQKNTITIHEKTVLLSPTNDMRWGVRHTYLPQTNQHLFRYALHMRLGNLYENANRRGSPYTIVVNLFWRSAI